MALPPEIEARIRESERRARELFDTFDSLADELEALSDDGEAPTLPGDVGRALEDDLDWEDPSVVRHREDLQKTIERVRRESTRMPSVNTAFAAIGGARRNGR